MILEGAGLVVFVRVIVDNKGTPFLFECLSVCIGYFRAVKGFEKDPVRPQDGYRQRRSVKILA